jgi:hypothetical protein
MATSTATTTATSTSTDAPDDREDVEVGGPPSSIASDVPPRRQGRSNINEFLGKRSGDTASAMAPSSAVPPDPPGRRDWQSSRDEYNRKVPPEDAPTRTRGFGLGEFQDKFSPSATEEKEEERADSQPGAFRVTETSERTSSETGDVENVAVLPPVPELPQSHENTQGQYLAEANLVLEPDLVFGEPLEDPTPYWSQPKVRRRALLVFLAVVGVVAGVSVGVGVGGQGGVPDSPFLGTTQTTKGFDTELEKDPKCWRTNAAGKGEIDIPFANPLVKDFGRGGEVELLTRCPALNYIAGEAPIESQLGERLRTGQVYNYKVSITVNLGSLGGNVFVSDEGPCIAVQVLMCNLGVLFCNPFIHEETNARLEMAGIFESTGAGESHGGTHIHSGYELFEVPAEGPLYSLVVDIPMQVNAAGNYFALVSAQMFIGEDVGEPAILRYDMASALLGDQRLISYQDPADIQVVPDSVLIISYVAVGIVALVILLLLVETIKNRNHKVLMLTQS